MGIVHTCREGEKSCVSKILNQIYLIFISFSPYNLTCCLTHSLISSTFCQTWRFWYLKLSHMQRSLCVSGMHKICVLWEKSVKNRLGNQKSWLPHFMFYKTTSNINIVFSNCLQTRYTIAIFSPWMICGCKSDHICQFNQIYFSPKILGQAPSRGYL